MAEGVERRVLQRLPLGGGDGRELVLEQVTYAPGVAAAPHRHPVAGLVYLLEGEAESAYEGEPPRRHRAGEVLQDRADARHVVFRNPDPERPLRFLASYVLEPGRAYVEPI